MTDKLGDKFAAFTKAFGIKPCKSCEERRQALNKLNLDAPARQVLQGLLEALMEPQKALDNGNQEDHRSEAGRPQEDPGEDSQQSEER